MRNRALTLLAFSFLFLFCNAQTPPTIQWQKSLGGTDEEWAYSVKQTNDGGYIVAGSSESNNGDVTGHHGLTGHYREDYWVVKLDSLGNIQWQKSYGGSYSDIANSIIQTNDDGYIVAGFSESNDGDVTGNHGGGDYWIVKLDTIGNIQWQKCYGGTDEEMAYSINQTNDGGYIVAGYTFSKDDDVTFNQSHDSLSNYIGEYWVVKLDTIGNIQWQKALGGTGDDRASPIQQTNDGGYIVVGGSNSNNNGDVTGHHCSIYDNYDCWVVKLDTTGNIQWQKSLGGTNNDGASSIQQTNDGGYIVGGASYSNDGDVTGNHGGYDCWIVKLDSIGNIKWQKCYGGSGDEGANIRLTIDGGYIFAGNTFSNDGDVTGHNGSWQDFWIGKIDSSGNLQWQKCLGGSASDMAASIQQTNDGGYIVAGASGSIDGDVTGNHNSMDYWVVKLGPAPLYIKEQKITSNISIYPNPSYNKFTVQVPPTTRYIQISNSLSQVIEKRPVANQKELYFEIKDNGIYFVQITTDKEIITKKVIICTGQ